MDYTFLRTHIGSAVGALIHAVRSRLPVSGGSGMQDPIHSITDTTIMGGWPKGTKRGTESMRWLLERSTDEGTADRFVWIKLERELAPIARALEEVKSLLEQHGREVRPLTQPFTRFLRHKLFTRSFERHGERKHLVISYFLVSDEMMVELQKAAFAVGMPKPQRKTVQRDKDIEARDKMIYDAARKGTAYSEIVGMVRRQYPTHLRISTARAWQVAHEYAKRQSLPQPPPRQQRRGR